MKIFQNFRFEGSPYRCEHCSVSVTDVNNVLICNRFSTTLTDIIAIVISSSAADQEKVLQLSSKIERKARAFSEKQGPCEKSKGLSSSKGLVSK